MTLEELDKISYNNLLQLDPFTGWKRTWGWTGRYYAEGIFQRDYPKYIVEIRTFPLGIKQWVPISLLKEIKDYVR